MSLRNAFVLGSVAGLIASCSGSGDTPTGGTDVQGLSTPEQLSIVTASTDAGVGPGGLAAGAGATDFPLTADYFSDEVSTWVYDPSVEPIQLVNEILCMVNQTRAGAMVNRGAYKAQIDTARCEQGSQGDDSEGQSSGASADCHSRPPFAATAETVAPASSV